MRTWGKEICTNTDLIEKLNALSASGKHIKTIISIDAGYYTIIYWEEE